jgi:hypothetical protein
MLRKIIAISVLILANVFAFSQDTLFTKKNKVIPCIVTEIGIDEIKYKDISNIDGPTYVIRKVDVSKIVFKNGKVEYLLPDEMDMNKEEEILDKNQVVKFYFLSPIFNHIKIGYERKLKMTQNLELKLGFIGFGNSNLNQDERQGAYFCGGVKFLVGKDYYIKGMKFLHPLKGTYLKPELMISVFDYNEKIYHYYQPNDEIVTYRASLFAFNFIYGKQFILGNTFTFDMYLGLGIGATNYYRKSGPKDSYDYKQYYFGSALLLSDNMPLVITSGISIGYIFK